MKLLRIGSSGADVTKWQTFLTGQGLYHGTINGVFDEATKAASVSFQQLRNLEPDGIVGDKTVGAAMLIGFGLLVDDDEGIGSVNFPPKPSFPPLASNAERAAVFGRFSFIPDPVQGNPEKIKVTDNFVRENIVTAKIPQLIALKGSPDVSFHKKGKVQLEKLWKGWETAGLLHLVLTYHGSYVARFVRGSTTTLSNHAFGTAFDINFSWNMLGAVPALVGRKGCVRELVAIANDNGFFWGGHFKRLDGMHFEVAVVK